MLKKAHGKSARVGHGTHRVEVPSAEKLQEGEPEPACEPERDERGRVIGGTQAASELARKGGLARARAARMRRLLGLTEFPEDHPSRPYLHMAEEWQDEYLRHLARNVGGGEVGPGPAAIVATAALQLAASRWAADRGMAEGNAELVAQGLNKHGTALRQEILAAHHLAALEVKSRKRRTEQDTSNLGEVFG